VEEGGQLRGEAGDVFGGGEVGGKGGEEAKDLLMGGKSLEGVGQAPQEGFQDGPEPSRLEEEEGEAMGAGATEPRGEGGRVGGKEGAEAVDDQAGAEASGQNLQALGDGRGGGRGREGA
jgi:hypothetical protein